MLQAEENIRAGMTPVEARRHARLKFGAVDAIQEDYHAEEGLLDGRARRPTSRYCDGLFFIWFHRGDSQFQQLPTECFSQAFPGNV